MSSWMAVRMKFGGGPDSSVDMVSPVHPMTEVPAGTRGPHDTASYGKAWAAAGRWGSMRIGRSGTPLRDCRASMHSGGITMRTKNRHRFCLAVLVALAVGVPRAQAQAPEF